MAQNSPEAKGVLRCNSAKARMRLSLGLTGHETYHVDGIRASLNGGGRKAAVRALSDDGKETKFRWDVSVETPQEVENCRNGGILPYVFASAVGTKTTDSSL